MGIFLHLMIDAILIVGIYFLFKSKSKKDKKENQLYKFYTLERAITNKMAGRVTERDLNSSTSYQIIYESVLNAQKVLQGIPDALNTIGAESKPFIVCNKLDGGIFYTMETIILDIKIELFVYPTEKGTKTKLILTQLW